MDQAVKKNNFFRMGLMLEIICSGTVLWMTNKHPGKMNGPDQNDVVVGASFATVGALIVTSAVHMLV
jgi:hypothetical protein